VTDDPPFEPEKLIAELEKRDVDYLVVGGIATVLHGAVLGTTDVDVLCSNTEAYLRGLAEALTSMSARVRGSPNPARPVDESLLKGLTLITFETPHGDLDILFEAKGGFTYAALADAGVAMEIEGTRIRVVSLDDLIILKRAAGRPQDLHAANMLEAVRGLRSEDAPRHDR
jgi:hypothetical protein